MSVMEHTDAAGPRSLNISKWVEHMDAHLQDSSVRPKVPPTHRRQQLNAAWGVDSLPQHPLLTIKCVTH